MNGCGERLAYAHRGALSERYWVLHWLHPAPRIAKHAHPRTCRTRVARSPAHLHIAEHALGVRHQQREAAIGGGHRGEAIGAAVRVEGVGLGRGAFVVDELGRAAPVPFIG